MPRLCDSGAFLSVYWVVRKYYRLIRFALSLPPIFRPTNKDVRATSATARALLNINAMHVRKRAQTSVPMAVVTPHSRISGRRQLHGSPFWRLRRFIVSIIQHDAKNNILSNPGASTGSRQHTQTTTATTTTAMGAPGASHRAKRLRMGEVILCCSHTTNGSTRTVIRMW